MKQGCFFTIVLTFFSSTFNLTAQDIHKDTVYLKNGQVLIGTIYYIQKHRNLTISADSGIFMYTWDQIKRYTYLYPAVPPEKINVYYKGDIKKSPYYITVELSEGYLVNKRKDSNNLCFALDPKITSGFNLDDKHAMAIGLGYYEFNNSAFIPFFVNYRYYRFPWQNNKIFIDFDIGYTICSGQNDCKGGINFNLAVGQTIPLTNRFNLFGSFGIGGQEYSFYQVINQEYQNTIRNIVLFNVSIGVLFD